MFKFLRAIPVAATVVAGLTGFLGGDALGQGVKVSVRPLARVTVKVDVTNTAKLAGTHPAVVERATVGARLSSSTVLAHMKLVLSSSEEQEAALRQLADEQQDKSSANFHKWLTPETFGQYFGAAPVDVAKVQAWLESEGFTVEQVAKSNRVITFTGTAGQVETAFSTEMHTLEVNGEAHLSNTTDISVPAALSTVVKGVASLNDFYPKANNFNAHQVKFPAAGTVKADASASPQYGATPTSTHYISPGDAATIYNTTPLASAGIDGTGQTIAVLARSNITISDVQTFRTLFGLKKNDPTITVVGQDPGQNADDVEAYLDAEWSGALAPSANVNFLVSSASLVSGGIDTAGLYAVENNIGDIISLSYGGCETNDGASGTAFWNDLWEQAAAQGQTAFVSSGDSGAAGCSSSSASYGSTYGVNALGSSAYNVAVGGTMFVDFGDTQYWGSATGIPYASALSYIPEAPLNQGTLSTTYLNSAATSTVTGSGIFSTGGGISIYTARPSWQTGSGISATSDPMGTGGASGIAAGSPISGPHRLVPDLVNISANGHDGTLFCYDEGCYLTTTGTLGSAGIVGGTSVATPVQAGIQALINQKNGGRQGNINYYLYKLAQAQYAASTTACQATLGTAANPNVTLPASTCNFHDVVTGNNTVATNPAGTTSVGFNAGTGYDAASGLGSMNVYNVATNWPSVTFTATKTAFTITPAAGIAHGANQTISVTVAPTTGTGVPTGDIALIAETTLADGPFQYTLTNGAYSGTVASAPTAATTTTFTAGLPAGSYNVHVHYAGDGTYGASDSASIPVTINPEASSISEVPYLVAASGAVSQTTSFAYASEVYLDTNVAGSSGKGVPTGTVTYTVTRNGSTVGTLATKLDTYGNTYLIAGTGFVNFYLKANFGALTPGSYVVTAAYSGDTNFAASNATTSFVVTQISPGGVFTVPATITSGASTTLGYALTIPGSATAPTTAVGPTGTVTFTDTTTGTALGTVSLNSASAASLTTSAITANGANTITAVYSGDVNYVSITGTATITVGQQPAPTVIVALNTSSVSVGSTVPVKVTLSTTTATGTAAIYDGTTYLATASIVNGVGAITLPAGLTLTAGTHTISAVYSGDANNASATGSFSLTIGQNAPALVFSAPLASVYGQTDALAVRLTRSPTSSAAPAIAPTGVVTFYDGSTAIGTSGLMFEPSNFAYGAILNISTLAVGSHSISATYAGDANYKTVTIGTYTLTVSALTPAITLTAPSSAYVGTASVPLTATIPLASNLAAPTGTISFYDGGTLLGTATATYSASARAYVATYTASGLMSGAQSLTAVLAADANYAMATSNALTITIETNNVWVVNANGTVSALANSGSAVTSSAMGATGTGTAIAIDASGNIWSANSANNSVEKFTRTGTVVSTGYSTGGMSAPAAMSFDGAGLLWIANGNNTISVLTSAGTAVSSTPYKSVLSTPTSLNVDASGNLWITNAGNNTVTEVIGAATPVTTPQTINVKNNTLASKP